MRPPDFWFNDPARPGWRARALAPLAAVAARATARRVARGAKVRPGCPVICVGNLNLGGTGKTPVVIATVARLAERGVARAEIVERKTDPAHLQPVHEIDHQFRHGHRRTFSDFKD